MLYINYNTIYLYLPIRESKRKQKVKTTRKETYQYHLNIVVIAEHSNQTAKL